LLSHEKADAHQHKVLQQAPFSDASQYIRFLKALLTVPRQHRPPETLGKGNVKISIKYAKSGSSTIKLPKAVVDKHQEAIKAFLQSLDS
jgi:hypothetical protein